MKKKMAIISVLLMAALLLASCAGQQNNGEKKLTAKDIEGTWIVSDSSTLSENRKVALDGFIVSAKPDDSAVLVFKDGKITAEWETQDGKQTSNLGNYEVSEGAVIINGFMTEARLEGKTLTLTELAPPKGEEVYKIEDGVYKLADDPSVTEVPEKAVMVLERK